LNPNIDLFFSSKDTVGKIEFLGTTYETQFTTNLAGYDLNLDVNILKGPLTPVITGGIGYINFSGEKKYPSVKQIFHIILVEAFDGTSQKIRLLRPFTELYGHN
jgi:hypothetical protein